MIVWLVHDVMISWSFFFSYISVIFSGSMLIETPCLFPCPASS